MSIPSEFVFLLPISISAFGAPVGALDSPTAAPVADKGVPVALHFGDVDGDAVEDVLAIDAEGAITLLAPRGEGAFEDITEASGLAALGGASCAVFADFDGDGDVDLFAGSAERRVWLNQGNASFVAVASGIEHDLVDFAADMLDFDADGRADLSLRTEAGVLLYRNLGGGRFARVALPGAEAPMTYVADRATEFVLDDVAALEVDSGPASRRLRRWARAQSSGGAGGTKAGVGCAAKLEDTVTGACMTASKTPALGRLFPLNKKLFVAGSGRVGMGTTQPTAGLHSVSDDGLVAEGTYGVGSIPATGAGSRVMWYPGKAAFRAGNVSGTEWDDASVGNFSIALGADAVASGLASVAIGAQPTASGTWAVALGGDTTASGNQSTAMGFLTVASGEHSTAMGTYATASGAESTAIGTSTSADSAACVAIGSYNVGGGSPTSWVGTDPIFEVGNGTFVGDHNALTVLKNGRVGLGTATPGYQLQLDTDSAAKPNSNTWTIASDARLKQNIEPLHGALERLLALRGVTFDWIDPASQGGCDWQQIGLIAQEVERVFPHWVGTDANGYKNLTVSGFEALTVESLRELQAQNDELRREKDELTARVTELESLKADVARLEDALQKVLAQR